MAPDQVQWDESRCGRTQQQHCSVLTVRRSVPQHTGLYRCTYRHRPQRQTSVYVYVTGKKTLLDGGSGPVLFFFSFPSPAACLSSVAPPSALNGRAHNPSPARGSLFTSAGQTGCGLVLNTDQCQEPIISKQCLSSRHILLNDSGTVSPPAPRPNPPFSPVSLFSAGTPPPSKSSKYKSLFTFIYVLPRGQE